VKLYITLCIYIALDPGSSNPSSSSDNNIGVIIGVVVAALVVIIAVIVIVACIFYRWKSSREKQQDVGNIQNAAYEDTQPQRRLPQMPSSDDDYEEPSDYAQLDSSIYEGYHWCKLPKFNTCESRQGSPTGYS
jgi:hypothetical protein